MKRQLTLSQRLVFGFSVILALVLAIAGIGWMSIADIGGRLTRIVEVNNPKTEFAHQLMGDINEMAIRTRSITLLTDVKEIDQEVAQLDLTIARYQKSAKALADAMEADAGVTEDERKLQKAIEAHAASTIPLVKEAARHGKEGANIEATLMLTGKVRPAEEGWRKAVGDLVKLEMDLNASTQAGASASQTRARLVTLAAAAGALVLGAVLAWRLTRAVTVPVGSAIQLAERIAAGDLSNQVEIRTHDEIGRLLQAVALMQDKLRELVGDIRQSAESISTASSEIATGNQDLSSRTEQTASNLQQTASSMEQLTGTVKQTADSARTANQLASSASASAAKGGEVVSQVVNTMDEITASSKKISDIIGVIDGIAFQTNILALNAAVEAARAGEQGRGFAVVAGEVRSLAQRSAEAAKEIKSLIGASVERVEAGSRLVQDAGSTMAEIVASVARVNDIIGEITAAASEQSDGIGQVNTAVTQLDQMTQQNASLVEESAAAAESLKEQAHRLTATVRAFRLDREEMAMAV
ncbi:methyl-accepting chemotaxis protein [Methylibium rhizosphaerae]|jgi:methyl-accepting chemotaxis protein|uniref:methyl-accepting chemotaxis protein n=1 Tax=Methylibium rhizosphaerae TaxID=2570323 RepID=UPI00112C88BA|nr:methyl-accepting chemotaxis protein [Methylibium rhizosphaerae]